MSDWVKSTRTGPPYATGRFETREQLEDYVVAQWRAGTLQKDIAADVGVSPPCVCDIIKPHKQRAVLHFKRLDFLQSNPSRRWGQ
jgi:hypothetical protein